MADTSCAGILPNPDLAGIGTRLNFYVTILLVAVIPQNKYTTELLDSLYMNAIFYGFALLITVLVQTIQVLHIYGITCVPMSVYYSVLIRDDNTGIKRFIFANRFGLKMKITIAFQVLQVVIIFIPWTLYVWIKGSQFGAQPECNDLVKYVFFFITVRATVGWLRIMFIVCFAASVLAWLVGLSTVPFVYHELTVGELSRTESGDVDDGLPWYFWIPSAAYGVASTELIVHRNHPHVQAGEDYWGFGQIVSIILILPIVIEILVSFKRWYSGDSD
ncbi:hypothetical protein BJY52DRAFT_1416530 [Lactarius psammicola]|nr:hypothetical protein BJY52DRAFT_1416530 [Lactarius psammicola]